MRVCMYLYTAESRVSEHRGSAGVPGHLAPSTLSPLGIVREIPATGSAAGSCHPNPSHQSVDGGDPAFGSSGCRNHPSGTIPRCQHSQQRVWVPRSGGPGPMRPSIGPPGSPGKPSRVGCGLRPGVACACARELCTARRVCRRGPGHTSPACGVALRPGLGA